MMMQHATTSGAGAAIACSGRCRTHQSSTCSVNAETTVLVGTRLRTMRKRMACAPDGWVLRPCFLTRRLEKGNAHAVAVNTDGSPRPWIRTAAE